MTPTVKVTEFALKHRILMYVLGTLGMVAAIMMLFSPSASADGIINQDTPASFLKDNGNEACRYLAFCRWDSLPMTGNPPIIAIPLMFIADLLFMIGHFIFFLVGQLFIIVDSLDIYYNMLYWGDSVFALIGSFIVGDSGGGMKVTGVLGYILFAVLLVFCYMFVAPQITNSKISANGRLSGMVWMIVGMLLLFIMSTNSAENHQGSSNPINVKNSNNAEKVFDTAALAKKPGSWEPLSLGWTVASINQVVSKVAELGEDLLTDVSDAMRFDSSNGTPSTCEAYVDSMHDMYGGNNEGAAVALDNLYIAAVLDQYVLANYGNSQGADNAWCRVLEKGEPVGDQVAIAWNGKDTKGVNQKLYAPAVNKMVNDRNMKWVSHPGKSIGDNPQFTGKNFGAGMAISLFSPPNLKYGEGNASTAHLNYFAACVFEDGKVKLNPEWNGVISATTDEPLNGGEDGKPNAICQGVLKSEKDFGDKSGWEIIGELFGADTNGVPFGFMNEDSGGTKHFSYQTQSDDIFALLFSTNADLSDKFVGSPGGMSGAAQEYYSMSSGLSYHSGILAGFVMIVTMFFMIKIIVPIIVGGAIAEFFAATSMAFLALTMVAMAVWPTKRVRSINIRTGAVVISGALVAVVFTAVFLTYSALFSLTSTVLTIESDNIAITSASAAWLNAVGVLLASIVSYMLMKFLLKQVLNFDASSMKAAAKSAFNTSTAPMFKKGETKKGDLLTPFDQAKDMFRSPVHDANKQSDWSKLRKAGSKFKDETGNLLGRTRDMKKNGLPPSAWSPQSATSTDNQKEKTGAKTAEDKKNGTKGTGTDADPLIGTIVGDGSAANGRDASGRNAAGMGAAGMGMGGHNGATGANGAGGGPKMNAAAGNSGVSDDQHRQRLLDQIRSSYGSADFNRVFPHGLPQDYASLIAKMSPYEAQKLSEDLKAPVTGSNIPRATPEQAAENMKKFNAEGAETLRNNPNGFDPSVGYAERAATQSEMFRNVNPVRDQDLTKMDESEKRSYDERKFDSIGDTLPDNRAVSFAGASSDVLKGEIVKDPLTQRSVPNAVVRSGSQNMSTMEGVTQEGQTIYGASRNADGSGNWDLQKLDSGSRQLPPSMLSAGSVPPAGVTPQQWSDINDMQGWIKQEDMKMDATSMKSWPEERQQQAQRLAPVMEQVMKSQGVPMVKSDQLESIAQDGVGVTNNADSFTFGSESPSSDFDPTSARLALTEGTSKMAELQESSKSRVQDMMSAATNRKLAAIDKDIRGKEQRLEKQLQERLAMTNGEAAGQLDGLLAELERSDSSIASKVNDKVNDNDWAGVLEVLDSTSDTSVNNDEMVDRLHNQIRTAVGNAPSSDHLTGLVSSLEEYNSSSAAQISEKLDQGDWDGVLEALNSAPDDNEAVHSLHNDIRRTVQDSKQHSNHLSGLVEALGRRDSSSASQINERLGDDDWSGVLDVLDNAGSGQRDNNVSSRLRDSIREVVESSKDRIDSLNMEHANNVARIYASHAEDRESIIEDVNLSVESSLQSDINRHAEDVRRGVFAGASTATRRHVEGIFNWFPTIKNKFFTDRDLGSSSEILSENDSEDRVEASV